MSKLVFLLLFFFFFFFFSRKVSWFLLSRKYKHSIQHYPQGKCPDFLPSGNLKLEHDVQKGRTQNTALPPPPPPHPPPPTPEKMSWLSPERKSWIRTIMHRKYKHKIQHYHPLPTLPRRECSNFLLNGNLELEQWCTERTNTKYSITTHHHPSLPPPAPPPSRKCPDFVLSGNLEIEQWCTERTNTKYSIIPTPDPRHPEISHWDSGSDRTSTCTTGGWPNWRGTWPLWSTRSWVPPQSACPPTWPRRRTDVSWGSSEQVICFKTTLCTGKKISPLSFQIFTSAILGNESGTRVANK